MFLRHSPHRDAALNTQLCHIQVWIQGKKTSANEWNEYLKRRK